MDLKSIYIIQNGRQSTLIVILTIYFLLIIYHK